MPVLPDIPQGIQNLADSALETFAANVALDQGAYFASEGRYLQLIKNPPDTPSGGSANSMSLGLKPHDQDDDWTAAPTVDKSPSIISKEVHVHNGPDGHGYTCLGRISIAGNEYIRAIGTGPGSSTFGWVMVEQE